MATKRAEFVVRVRDFMAPGGREGPLDAFIATLTFEQARDCTTAYFGLEPDYRHARPKFVTVFGRLALHALDVGDAYYALRTGILIAERGTPWERHYTALTGRQKSALDGAIKRKKGALTPTQRQFLEWFALYMKRQASADRLYRFVSAATFKPREDCLYAYIEASQAYADRNGAASVLVFERLSRLAIDAGTATFANLYHQRVTQVGTPWHERFQALAPGAQSAIDRDIARVLVVRRDVTVGGRTYQDVPVGKGTFHPVAPERVEPADRAKPAALTAAQQKYLRLYRQYVADGKRESMDALQTFFRERPRDIAACVAAYLQDSPGSDPRSLQVFFGTVWEAVRTEEPYYAFKVHQLILTPGTIWRDRFRALDKRQYGDRLMSHIAEKREKARLLDELKAEYLLKHHADPTPDALARFEPVIVQEQEALLSKGLSDCEVGVNVDNVEFWEKGFTAVNGVFAAQGDAFTLLVLLKRCRERQKLDVRFRNLVYLDGLFALFLLLRRRKRSLYRAGFNRAEADFLLAGIDTRNRSFRDFVVHLEYAIRKDADLDTMAALCRVQGSLHIHADRAKIALTPMVDAAALTGAVQELWLTRPDEVRAIRIPIESRWDGPKKLTVGQTIGNFDILWWDGTSAYLFMKGLGQTVFDVGPPRLAAIYDKDATIGEIVRGTAHLERLIPLLFEVLSYLPDLVLGGTTALIRSIAFDYAFDASIEALGVDPTKASMITLGVGLLKGGRKPSDRGRPAGAGEPDLAALERKSLERNARLVDGKDRMVDAPATDSVGHAAAPTAGGHPATDGATTGTTGATARTDMAAADVVPTSGTRATRRHVVTVPDRRTKDAAAATVDTATPKTKDTPRVKRERRPEKPRVKDAAAASRIPPAAVPVRVSQGTWTQKGLLSINQGGLEIRDPSLRPSLGSVRPTGPKKQQLLVDSKLYEHACQQQVFPKLAAQLAGRAVVVKAPGDAGYRTPSSQTTPRLKLQKAVQGDILKRIPEGHMELVQGTGKNARKAEAHFFEATLESDFRPTTGRDSHKPRQIAGTLWISREIKRKGYTPDTKLVYHIASPAHPGDNAVKYLNQVMEEMPNVAILWYIVR